MGFIDEASAAIRDAGGRFTSQRRLIVELLERNDEHLDAERLYQKAHDRDESISLATVYRTLNVLESAGLIDRLYLGRAHDRQVYEPLSPDVKHYHFTCRKCHRVIEFETLRVEQVKQALELAFGVQADHACLCIEGLCYTCRQPENPGGPN
jgi:Fe2+ or Zn2+ uptake regulation protein